MTAESEVPTTDGPDPAEGPRRGVAGSSAVMFAGTLVSRILGMVKSPLLLGAAIGINYGAANAFSVANKLPNLIYMLIAGGVLNAILVPQIVRAIRNDADGGRTYVNRLLTLGMVGLAGITVILTLAAPLLISLYAVGLPPPWHDLAVTFGYWCIPQLFFYGMYTMVGQVLNARNIFGPYMWAPAVNNLVAIAGLVAYLVVFGGTAAVDPEDASVWGLGRTALLAGTATLGVAAQALVLLIPLYRSGFRYRPQWGLRGSGLGTASRMALWVFAALAANQAAYVVVSNVAAFASRASSGADDVAGNAAYDTAFLLYTLPTSLVTVSLVTALFTRISANAAASDLGAVRVDLSKGLRTVSVFTIFATAGLMVLAQPVVRVIAATVSFPEVQSIAHVAVAMVPGLVAVGIFTMCQRIYYAFEDARGLFRLQIPMVVILAGGAAAAMLLPPQWIVVGIGVAMTVSNWVGATVTYLGLRRHLRTLDGHRVLRTHIRLVIAVIPAALLGWLVLRLFGTGHEMTLVGALWRILVVGLVSGVVYLFMLRALRVEELRTLVDPVGRLLVMLGRRIPGPVGAQVVRLGMRLAPSTRSSGPDDGPPPPPPPPSDPPPRGGSSNDSRTEDGDTETEAGGAPPETGVESPTGEPPRIGAVSGASLRTLDAAGEHDRHDETGGPALDGRNSAARVVGGTQVVGDRYALGATLESTVGGVERRLARDLTLEVDVEVLVLPPTGSKVAEVLDAARRAALVSDHRLVRVLDVGTDEAAAYVVTSVVAGPDLAALSRSGGLPPAQARAVVGETASALEAARRHGVRHLALRPECVHVTPDGEVLVSGLGTDAVLLGTAEDPDGSPLTADRRDATGIVHLLYLALTGSWPADGSPAPHDVRPETPGDLDQLCTRTFQGEGPRSTGELLRLLAPWPSVDPRTMPGLAHGSAPIVDDGAAAESGAADPAFLGSGTLGFRPIWAPIRPVASPSSETADVDETAPRPPGPTADVEQTAPRPPGPQAHLDVPPPPPNAPTSASLYEAPAPRTLSWKPPVGTASASPPQFPEIVERSSVSDHPHPSQHPTEHRTGPAAGLAIVAAGLADAIRTGARKTVGGTKAAANATRTKAVSTAVSARAKASDAFRGNGTGYDDIPHEEPEDGDLLSAVDGPEVPFKERRMNPTPVVLVAVVALVLVLLLISLRVLFAPPEPVSLPDNGPPPTAEATEEAAEEPAQEVTTEPEVAETADAGPPAIADMTPIDPEGDGLENPELTSRALDGDAESFWRSRSYVDASYGMKSGIGLVVNLEEAVAVSRVEIDLMGEGGLVEIRATSSEEPTEGEPLASGSMGPDSAFEFDPVETDTLVLWFPQLPVAESDGLNRIEMAELRVG